MYNYGSTGSIFDSVSNVYLLSTATVLLAVIIAFYMSNLLKDVGLEKPARDDCKEQLSAGDSESELQRARQLARMGGTRPFQASDAESDSDGDLSNPSSDGLVCKLKSARRKELEAQLTLDQLEEERRIEREQLAAIFELLKKQEAELNMKEIDEDELAAQLNLYR